MGDTMDGWTDGWKKERLIAYYIQLHTYILYTVYIQCTICHILILSGFSIQLNWLSDIRYACLTINNSLTRRIEAITSQASKKPFSLFIYHYDNPP